MRDMYIYGLREVGTDVIRYVGKANNLTRRRAEHIREAKKKCDNHKTYWINKVINSGSNIEIIILEVVNEDTWQDREKFWINSLRKNLTNVCDGGLGGIGNHRLMLNYDELKKIIKNHYPFITTRKIYIDFFKGKTDLNLIPKDPYQHYKRTGQWVSWSDLLGTNNISVNVKSNNYLSYEETKSWVNTNLPHIKTAYDWLEYIKYNELPSFITKKPNRLYNNGIKFSFKNFLNSKSIKKRSNLIKFLNYIEAKEFIKNNINFNHTKSVSVWLKYYTDNQLKEIIPYDAMTYYKKTGEWISWNDFLGNI